MTQSLMQIKSNRVRPPQMSIRLSSTWMRPSSRLSKLRLREMQNFSKFSLTLHSSQPILNPKIPSTRRLNMKSRSTTWAQTRKRVLQIILNLVVMRTARTLHRLAALMRVTRVLCWRKDLIKSMLNRTTISFIIWGKEPINRIMVLKIQKIKRALSRR